MSGSQSVWIHRLVERLWAGAGWISRLSTDIECLGICVCVCPLVPDGFPDSGCTRAWMLMDSCFYLLRLSVARECVRVRALLVCVR